MGWTKDVNVRAIGLAIAASCGEDELASAGGNVGTALFARSREIPTALSFDAHTARRPKITLAIGPLRRLIQSMAMRIRV